MTFLRVGKVCKNDVGESKKLFNGKAFRLISILTLKFTTRSNLVMKSRLAFLLFRYLPIHFTNERNAFGF